MTSKAPKGKSRQDDGASQSDGAGAPKLAATLMQEFQNLKCAA